MSSLAIVTDTQPDDSISYHATYTALNQIDFTLGVDGPGIYTVGATLAEITNNTGASFPFFYALLEGASAGVKFTGAGLNTALWGFPTFTPTQITFGGPPAPGLGAGDTTNISLTLNDPDPGPQTFEVVLTPTLTPVPEPAAWAMLLAGFGGLGAILRSRRRRATVSA